MRPTRPKKTRELASEWDVLASIRDRQLRDGLDTSHRDTLSPFVLDHTSGVAPKSILDVGCGTGVLTRRLASIADQVVGIDPSVKSIAMAQETEQVPQIRFVKSSVEDFARSADQKFDVVVANMVLMDVANLESALGAIAHLTRSAGAFVATFTHPWFWPVYWGYAEEEWFDYRRETFIEAPFSISGESVREFSTHIHRPIDRYVEGVVEAGFSPPRFTELYPSGAQLPRFLGFKAIRGSH